MRHYRNGGHRVPAEYGAHLRGSGDTAQTISDAAAPTFADMPAADPPDECAPLTLGQ